MSIVEKEWTSISSTTKVFDISKMIQYLTMDVITHLMFDEPFGYVRTQRDIYHILWELQKRLPLVEMIALFPEIYSRILFISYIPWVRKILPNRHDKHGVGRVMQVCGFSKSDSLL